MRGTPRAVLLCMLCQQRQRLLQRAERTGCLGVQRQLADGGRSLLLGLLSRQRRRRRLRCLLRCRRKGSCILQQPCWPAPSLLSLLCEPQLLLVLL